MATFTWNVVECERNLSDGGIFMAHWTCVGTEEADGKNYTMNSYGAEGLTPDSTDSNFIQYEDVVESDVLGWIWAGTAVDKTAVEESLQAQIDLAKTPTTSAGVPW